MGLSHSPSIVMNGLVFCIDAGNTKSLSGPNSLSLSDLTGRNADSNIAVTGESPPTYSSANGGCVLLDGLAISINSYFDDDLFVNDNSLTFSIFVNIDEPTKDIAGALVSTQRYETETDPGGYGFVIPGTTYGASNSLAVNLTKDISGTKTSYQVIAPFTYVRQQFRYYTFTYNSSTKTVTTYMNDVLQNSSTNSNYGWTVNTQRRIAFIGANHQSGWSGQYYKMKIGAVHLYNRALTASEIQQNFNALRGRFNI